MKLMDEKGRLFGKLNIIDALVAVILIVAVAFVGMKLKGNNDVVSTSSGSTEIEFTVLYYGALPENYEVVRNFVNAEQGLSDQMMAGSELLPGYVVDCVATPHISYVTTDEGEILTVESSGNDTRLDLLFTCRATVTDTVTNKLGSQEIRSGISHILKTTHFEFSGSRILSVKWLESDQ